MATTGTKTTTLSNSNSSSATSTNGYHANGSGMAEKYLPSTASGRSLPPVSQNVRPEKLGADRKGITAAFTQFGQLVRTAKKPLPAQGGNGDPAWTGVRLDLKHLRYKDIKTLLEVIKSKVKSEQVADDKTYIMERVIQLVAGLPSNSKNRVLLTNNFLNELWYSLEHPPSIYVGDEFMYRKADGSFNNIRYPKMGAAGTTYARSVRPSIVGPGALPDPALIFDTLMGRGEYKKHPNNVSVVLWYWATIIIHDLFWTDYRNDDTTSKTSSYLDLSPLYGSNQEMQDSIRTFTDGLMKPDTFADKRLHGMPPGVSVILIMFNRFHNHVAHNLAAINEGGRFSAPPPGLPEHKAAAAWKKRDEDLFQTARLVTSGLYINITLVDYVRNIVNLNRADTTWTLDPRQEMGIDVGTKGGADRGTGNVVSAEFNLCYRWHSCISAKDDKWIQGMYQQLFGKPAADVTLQDMMMGMAKFGMAIPDEPERRPVAGLQRGPDGRFGDDELVAVISDAVEDCAGAFGARNVPQAMRPVEILGILQGRKWKLAGLNEFRQHFGLNPYETFEDINSDPEVAESLRHLYTHPDFVELYPGLVAEEAKTPMVPGVGIAPTYTISRVVLSDAVCLVRGDRYYTTDYNPRHLTNWGFNEVQYDLNINHGCVFYKLFIRAFPNHFKANSVYAHYPMVIPSENHRILTSLGRVSWFDFSRPMAIRPPVAVSSYEGARHVLSGGGSDKYGGAWGEVLGSCPSSGKNTGKASGANASTTIKSLDDAHVRSFLRKIMDRLLADKSCTVPGGRRYADVVRDVANLASVHLAASLYNLPMKQYARNDDSGSSGKKGIYTDYELYAVLALLNTTAFHDSDPVKSFPLRMAAGTVAEQLVTILEGTIRSATGILGRFSGGSSGSGDEEVAAHGQALLRALVKAGVSPRQVAKDHVLPAAAVLAPNLAGALAQAVDFYLSPAGSSHVSVMHEIACQTPSAQADALLLGYALEGIRLGGAVSGSSYLVARAGDAIPAGDGAGAGVNDGGVSQVAVQAGDRVYVNLATTSRDPTIFPDPEVVNPSRALDSYLLSPPLNSSATGDSLSLSSSSPLLSGSGGAGRAALAEMFRALFRRRNLRRAPGPQGEIKRVARYDGNGGGQQQQEEGAATAVYLAEDWSAVSAFPTSMRVMWDE